MNDRNKPTLREKAKKYLGEGWSTHDPSDFERYHRTRRKRAEKIRAVLASVGAIPLRDGVILDIGCSSGEMINAFSDDGPLCVGVDMDASAEFVFQGNTEFAIADGECLPFRDRSVNVVLCNHIYEHTDDPKRLVDEIWRVLVPDGFCYFAGPSKWEVIEPHYRLPFLSWLPGRLADLYMRITRKGSHYLERPLSRRKLLALLENFEVQSFAEQIIREPRRFHTDDLLPEGSLRQKLALVVSNVAPGAMPGFVFLCRKRT